MKPDVGSKRNQKANGKRLKTLGDYSTDFAAPASTHPRLHDGARSQAYRPRMEPRDRGGESPPRCPARRRAVEDYRVGGAGGAVVRRAVRGAGLVRTGAALKRARTVRGCRGRAQ